MHITGNNHDREGEQVASSKIYYIDMDRENKNTAGSKAPDDISYLCSERGYERFAVPNFPAYKHKIISRLWLLVFCTAWWVRLAHTVQKNDIVIFQHPMYGKRTALKMIPKIKNRTDCKFVAVIHDLESLRGGIEGGVNKNPRTNKIGDEKLLKCFDKVICHNEHMKEYMMNVGFASKNIVCLEIFDYICDLKKRAWKRGDKPSVAIAGNLLIGKCRYIYDICKGNSENLIIHLYGINFEKESSGRNMFWHGSFKPQDLPAVLEGDFGLVWDGISAKTCTGNTGEYLKYNNPHKTSLYLASGMPVIVWKQAAIADFVIENGVGIAVDSLYGLDHIIANISDEEYYKMCTNANSVGKKLRSGYYFTSAFEKCLESLFQS